MLDRFNMLIDGEYVEADSKKLFEVRNPATSEVVGEVPLGDRSDVHKALEAAQKAFEKWRTILPAERAEYIMKAAKLIKERAELIGKFLTLEQGKPLPEAKGEIKGAAEVLEYYAEEAYRICGEVIPPNVINRRSIVIKQPIGVTAAIGAWNYPVSLLMWKVAPALITGCTTVIKPASYTPISPIKTFECFVDVGLPQGVINVVTGSGNVVGNELIKNPIAKKISFTGETQTGKEIMSKAGENLKRLTLELGGNCPLIVCEDADINKSVKGGVYRSFRNMGQVCNSINRIYVEKPIASEFIDTFVKETKKLRIGNGFDSGVDLGPMVSEQQRQHTKEHIKDAIDKGAKLLCGGKEPEGDNFKKGFFYEPTVLTDVNHTMRVMQEETFGPVAPIMVVDNLEEGIKWANNSRYGLVSYAYTNDLKKATLIAESLEAGTVGINNVAGGEVPYPYGGWKESGLGTELSALGVEEFLNIKHIRIEI